MTNLDSREMATPQAVLDDTTLRDGMQGVGLQLSIEPKLRQLLQGLDSDVQGSIVARIKQLRTARWAFEDADASLELLVTPGTPGDEPPFALPESLAVARETSTPRAAEPSRNVQASVTVMVAGAVDHTAAEAAGPVEALDTAPRRALAPHLPTLGLLQLVYSYEWAARHAASLACLFPTA